MRRSIVLFVATAVLVPAVAMAGTSAATRARSDCAKLRAGMGGAAFVRAYPTFGACVSRYAPVEQQVTASANATCSAQQADPNFAATHGGKAFTQYYGTGGTGKNAFSRCVAAVAKADRQAEQQGRMNPARTCRSIRTQLGTSIFAQTYEKSPTDRNAFGKCVSQTAHAQVHSELSASATCAAEQSDPNFASTHGGQTFAQHYGTNADDSNAFGMCVSTTAKALSTSQAHATVAAALACKAEKKADPTAFKAKYASFRACVKAQPTQ